MVIEEEVTLELPGVITLPQLKMHVWSCMNSDRWMINMDKWRANYQERVKIVSGEPLVREFVVPLTLRVDDGRETKW